MANENFLSLFDDNGQRQEELLLEELLADAADSLCETETTKNYSKKKGQLEKQINAELDNHWRHFQIYRRERKL